MRSNNAHSYYEVPPTLNTNLPINNIINNTNNTNHNEISEGSSSNQNIPQKNQTRFLPINARVLFTFYFILFHLFTFSLFNSSFFKQ